MGIYEQFNPPVEMTQTTTAAPFQETWYPIRPFPPGKPVTVPSVWPVYPPPDPITYPQTCVGNIHVFPCPRCNICECGQAARHGN